MPDELDSLEPVIDSKLDLIQVFIGMSCLFFSSVASQLDYECREEDYLEA